MIIAAKALIGFLVILLGRQFTGLYVGVMGFLAAIYLVPQVYTVKPGWNLIIIAGVIAAICSLLTIPLKRVAAVLASGVAGGLLIYILPEVLGSSASWVTWPVVLVAGGLAVLIVAVWFDALIVISAVLGAALLAQNFHLGPWDPLVIFIVAMVFGLAVQLLLLRYEVSAPE